MTINGNVELGKNGADHVKNYEMTEHNKTEFRHEMLDVVKHAVASNTPTYLWGEAGTGKNVMCEQITQELGYARFGFTNAILETYQLQGFVDANGKYQATQFHEVWTKGGVFMLDELDGSNPEALIWLNAAIANRYAFFPYTEEKVESHPDFRFVAGGNSNGMEHDPKYKRKSLDAASLNRFAMFEIKWSPALEEKIYNKASQELVGALKARLHYLYEAFKMLRSLNEEMAGTYTISTRTLSNIIALNKSFPEELSPESILDATIFQGRKDKSIYMKELRSLKMTTTVVDNVTKTAGDISWTPSTDVCKEIIDIFESARTGDMLTGSLAELIKATNASLDISEVNEDSLLSIRTTELAKPITPLQIDGWNNGDNPKWFASVVVIKRQANGKLTALLVSGQSATQRIESGDYTLVTWDGENHKGIAIDTADGSTEDHSLISSAILSNK